VSTEIVVSTVFRFVLINSERNLMEARNFMKVRPNRVSLFLTCHVSIDSVCDNLHCICYMTVQLELSFYVFPLIIVTS
jgi:hypothetical protein